MERDWKGDVHILRDVFNGHISALSGREVLGWGWELRPFLSGRF